MALQDLEIPTGKYSCVNRQLDKGGTVGDREVKDLKERGMGGYAFSDLRKKGATTVLRIVL